MGWDLGPGTGPLFLDFWILGPGITAFFELGPGPRPLFEPGTWDLGYLEGGLTIVLDLVGRMRGSRASTSVTETIISANARSIR